ncbi:Eco57I restriction-modification methylase domain-containing protein, partial [Bizionia paragorgiae]|uniref:Eco57I restriction-modification methylase domain-containing protein n=2 Tax=Flavobacteriaceae TaxID=49546 RepID=UPI003A8F2045
MKNLLFTLDEEEKITIVDVKQRISENFAKNSDQVTKKFYTDFKKQHVAFLDFIQGIDDHIGNKTNENKQWYASLMLNRLMFCYFIQKKGFLDQDLNYLQNKLKACQSAGGNSNFYSFYRSFLLELFHDGLGKPQTKRTSKPPVELGKIPYLNGGLFDVHELEHQFTQIQIADDAFKKIFNFFDQWNWHLDNSIEATGKDINPDVIGYIFEKYINDRASMGAYYTKEDITDYIGKNTVIPFLFDETERHHKEAFKLNSELFNFIKESGDTYIYDAVKYGIPETNDLFADLPEDVKTGINHPLENNIVQESSSPHLWEIRNSWNQKVPEDIGLPTEIYRELIERRKRYAEIKSIIVGGEISSINDFITYNLNIRQFTQDFIENTQDAAFIRHFYKAINKITILDPTCGSGAFLFAALNILEPLYEACIMRMEQFVVEQPGKHKFFEDTLAEVNGEHHPSLQYFIYKSIILNNLYGVDIMKEAVEIAKLRLFLKLVATVDVNPRKANFGLEPLPDIDFNIRAGNTLIGFATENELLETIQKKEALFAQEKLDEFKEESLLVNKAYSHFQNCQLVNDQGSDSFKKAKADLSGRLKELNQKLNIYLATNYGITDLKKEIEIEVIDDNKKKIKKKVNQFNHWLNTHQPFHWYAEFYQIIAANGGFDCIIGNPPYVEYSKVKKQYIVQNFETLKCNNLYCFVMERSRAITNQQSKFGMIVPLSISSGQRMTGLRSWLKKNLSNIYLSNFEIFPSKLFEGAFVRTSIIIAETNTKSKIHFNTKLLRWYSIEREILIDSISYYKVVRDEKLELFKKNDSKLNDSIFFKLNNSSNNKKITSLEVSNSNNFVFYQEASNYWIKAVTRVPFYEKNGVIEQPDHGRVMYFNNEIDAGLVMLYLNSTFFYVWYSTYSDGFHLSSMLVKNFPINTNIKNEKVNYYMKILLKSIQENSYVGTRNTKKGDQINIETFKISLSKGIIDEIDNMLAQNCNLTEVELDFIINYDIKYRMGKALFGEDDNDEDDD